MAQKLNATLTLSSTAGVEGASNNMDIDLSVSDTLTIAAPLQGLSTVIADNTGANTIIKPAGTAVAYLYVKNTGTTNGATASDKLVDVEETGDAAFARLGPDEFMFVPFNHHAGNVGIQLQVTTDHSVQMEYAWFTKG